MTARHQVQLRPRHDALPRRRRPRGRGRQVRAAPSDPNSDEVPC
jgi:hypothetical protein